jgi:Spy/CpxP family protein refolding chaperone
MRKSRVIGFVVATLVSTASLAHAQSSAPSTRHERHAAGQLNGKKGHGGLFRGITLSDAEKARIKQIHTKYSPEVKPLRESLRPAMQDARAARQKGDTAGMKAAWDKTAGDRAKLRGVMDRERAEIRTALAPENQRTFDANVKQMEQRRAEGGKHGKGGRRGLRAS